MKLNNLINCLLVNIEKYTMVSQVDFWNCFNNYIKKCDLKYLANSAVISRQKKSLKSRIFWGGFSVQLKKIK